MHTVCETRAFRRAAEEAGMSEADITGLVDHLAIYPFAGVEIIGTGGCRKLRWGGRGKGKSGGFRTVTFYSGEMMPVFLITAFSKGERSNLSRKEINSLKQITTSLVKEYQTRIAKVGEKG